MWHLYPIRTPSAGPARRVPLVARDPDGPPLPAAGPPLAGLRVARARARRLPGHRGARRRAALAAHLPGHLRAAARHGRRGDRSVLPRWLTRPPTTRRTACWTTSRSARTSWCARSRTCTAAGSATAPTSAPSSRSSAAPSIGARCKIQSHTFICDGVEIEDEVFVGHGVMFVNDTFPRATTADGSRQADGDWELVRDAHLPRREPRLRRRRPRRSHGGGGRDRGRRRRRDGRRSCLDDRRRSPCARSARARASIP